MKFYINPTAYSTMRVWVELSGVPMQQFLKDTLDILSCWGGADKRGENYISWEIGGDVVAAVRRFLTKYDCIETDSPFESWLR